MLRYRTPLIATAWLVLLLAGCASPPPPREFDGEKAMARVQEQLAFGPRVPGTPGHAAMAAWLDSLASAKADQAVTDRWNHLTASGDTLALVNVMARFNPEAPARILYLAHWDTRPVSDGANSTNREAPVPGANDGASGVAVLLGVIDALAAAPPPPSLGVDIVFVDGEDFGDFGPPRVDVLIGSTRHAGNMPPDQRPVFAVVWDMVGATGLRIGQESLSLVAASDVVSRVWGAAAALGYGHLFVQETIGAVTDDHVPYIDVGI
ncbi:MAG TPA: M28 family peptidase, partial [Gemmatimonadales bacterium]|nr:M28 family peptidase [Gemmatimonadales bacterium]